MVVRVFALCDKRYEAATRKAAGSDAIVVTCPPYGADDAWRWRLNMEHAELVYLNLHADPERDDWFTFDNLTALRSSDVSKLDLSQTVVFMVNCFAGGGVLPALKTTQPKVIVGGQGENFGGPDLLCGADMLGLWFRRGLQFGLNPYQALALGKRRLALMPQTRSVRDALQFEVLYDATKV